ncbi:MAG: hypothetical protein EAX81_06935 [Candidatus Thorarchaeota archaeon]|nr:hypothetical protein [Candidatus Thorarchaeota archaeon]
MPNTAMSDAKAIVLNPTGFFQSLVSQQEDELTGRFTRRPVLFLATFLVIYSATIPIWIALNDWILGICATPILDFHYGNQVFLSIHKDWYPLFYSYTGSIVISWLLCIPVVYLDTIVTALFFALFLHMAYKYVLGGQGQYGHAVAGVCYGDLPSLLFGFLPFSAAIGLLWTGFLQFSATAHYLYGLSWNRALIPLVLFGFTLVIGWSLFGTVSPPGLLELMPYGPYGYP